MPRATYGPKVRARAKSLLKILLLFVNGEVENSDRFDLKYCWLDEEKPPQLRIETNLRTLEALTNSQENRLTKAQIRESLKRMDDFLNILKDERIQKRGLEDWRFTLTLCSKDIEENLQQFSKTWDNLCPQTQEKLISESIFPPIPELNSIPEKLNSEHLDNLLQNHWERLNNTEKNNLENAIQAAFQLCDPAQDWIEGDRLDKFINLSQVSYPGWSEIDGLTQFAVFLATFSDNLSSELFDEIKVFVESRQTKLNFNNLLIKAIREKSERNISPKNTLEDLIIEVIPTELSKGVRVSMWDANNFSSPLVQDETMSLDELPNFLENWLEENSEYTSPTLHIFVPRNWLNLDLSERQTESELTLGSQYKLVMRTHHNLTPTGKQYYKLWQQKWQLLEAKIDQTAQTTFVRADCGSPAKLFQTLKSSEMAILENLDMAKLEKILEFVARKTALPVALWSRRSELSDRIDNILDCEVNQLSERILEERCNSLTEDDNHIGHHLTLVWEDPNIVPPTLQFDSEAC
ncbi:hypothetical protein [Limnoraphis robusta]|uniref:Uncharacterized protein n=1 Tax=Limnoraphis robusta CS-951 TaxID=1637645 RepID=A0A0J9EX85_9CYAN|nr:hypothetical protein [Limnoraphis robusta]KMW70582.1 hypothetical protein WN50_34175 [Limnoraphis robusta CS-951]